ncbi:hypothetical protein Cfor_07553, partial [Coptotermes formosanus]
MPLFPLFFLPLKAMRAGQSLHSVHLLEHWELGLTWMCGELRTSMSQRSVQPGDMPQPPPKFKVIYPSLQNVKNSHDDLLGDGCLPYSRQTHEKQTWLRKFL